MQKLCGRLAKACTGFSMTISLKKTVVMNTQTTTHSQQRLTAKSCRQVPLSGICCQLFLQPGRRNDPTNWKGFEQLRATQFMRLEQSSPHYQTKRQSPLRVHPEWSASQQRDVVHVPPPRKTPQRFTLQMLPLLLWCLVEEPCPRLPGAY